MKSIVAQRVDCHSFFFLNCKLPFKNLPYIDTNPAGFFQDSLNFFFGGGGNVSLCQQSHKRPLCPSLDSLMILE